MNATPTDAAPEIRDFRRALVALRTTMDARLPRRTSSAPPPDAGKVDDSGVVQTAPELDRARAV